MIYLINNSLLKVNISEYSYCDLDFMFKYFDNCLEFGLDIETTGLDPYIDSIVSVQIGDTKNQFVIDASTIDIKILKDFLEKRVLIGQNIKFDLRFFYRLGIFPLKVWDTYVAEKVIYCGYQSVRHSLDSIVERRLGIKLDKSVRANIPKEGLSTRVIIYGAKDVEYLLEIKKLQEEDLKDKGLSKTMYLENRFTPVLAYIEYCGFKLDKSKWKSKMDQDLKRMVECENKLNEWVLKNSHSKFIESQLSLFEPVSCKICWSSPKQVLELFNYLNIDCSFVEKGVKKQSVESSVIGKYSKTHEIVRMYLEYKKAEKVVTTYGESFIKQINPVSKRLHTQFQQIMDTGRISSGKKDKITKENYPNFQNIPADKETRSCFVAEDGSMLIVADYAGQEQIILANKSLDPGLLEFYDKGLGDMHSFVCSKMYPELENLSVSEIKEKHKEKRDYAKSAGFAINILGN